MAYIPRPIDTSDILISREVLEAAEVLSKNTHDVWARGKIKDGYVYGKATDEKRKTHKSLVPYESLSSAEKEYDYNTAMETVKALIKLGFRIERVEK